MRASATVLLLLAGCASRSVQTDGAADRWPGVICGSALCEGSAPICCDLFGSPHCTARAACAQYGTDCDGPEDCPADYPHCVVGALGGQLGCAPAVCCGMTECSNGCHTDQDCPSCRPVCRGAGQMQIGICDTAM